jgi:hypothetical protein
MEPINKSGRGETGAIVAFLMVVLIVGQLVRGVVYPYCIPEIRRKKNTAEYDFYL